jgi:hypothetical protein
MPACGVVQYDLAVFCRLVAEASNDQPATFEKSVHAEFFKSYFEELGARTILVEEEYTDRDYLEDYAAYYSRCFHSFPRTCRRLHFLATELAKVEYDRILSGDDTLRGRVQQNYLGFVVVRPIPGYAIGRTCLRTYSEHGPDGVRAFPATREYEVNLQGVQLSLRSLAFQQQDRVVAACATAALWSAFHGTGVVFQHRIPSPVDITRNATAHIGDETRAIPSSGLNPAQMADAIRACGLEPVMIRTHDVTVLKGAARAYLLGRIPVLMIGGIYVESEPEKEKAVHAVTISGFCSKEEAPKAGHIRLESDRISKFYVHDDGVGPFARMVFEPLDRNGHPTLTTSVAPSSDAIGSHFFRPEGLLLPVYHKLRVAYPTVLAIATRFEKLLGWLRENGATLPEFTWDIRLTTVNDYKRDCLENAALGDGRRHILEATMPRFIWLIRGTEPGGALDILLDATGLEQMPLCFRCVAQGTDLPEWFAALGAQVVEDSRQFDCADIAQQILDLGTQGATSQSVSADRP